MKLFKYTRFKQEIREGNCCFIIQQNIYKKSKKYMGRKQFQRNKLCRYTKAKKEKKEKNTRSLKQEIWEDCKSILLFFGVNLQNLYFKMQDN